MKKLLFLLALTAGMLAGTGAKSQMASPKTLTTTSFGLTLDTVTNGGQKVTTPADGKVSTWRNAVTAFVTVKKISGTVGGTLALQGSMDGVEFTTIGTPPTVTDASANYGFNTNVRYYYYRISWTGTGTMSASMKCYLYTY
jgi:hypothetical protein